MSKKEIKKVIKRSINEAWGELERRNSSPKSMSAEAQEWLGDDKFRQEAYGFLQDWFEKAFQSEFEKLTEERSNQITELKALLKKEQKNYGKYQMDVQLLKESNKRVEKKISKLEEHDKEIRNLFVRIVGMTGLILPGDSFKKGCKNLKKYVENHVVDKKCQPQNNTIMML